MPSDEAIGTIESAFVEARANFRSAVTRAVEELRGMIDAHTSPATDRSTRTAAELGEFAAGRIDMDRFAAITSDGDTLDPSALALLERAKSTLSAMLAARGAQFMVNVVGGGDVVADVGASMVVIGRAFGAARAAELVRLGRPAEAARADTAGAFPFHRWTRAERRMAPPLIVQLEGEGLQVGGLAAYLDGTQKLVLVVEGASPPAALVRLITPGVFVMQTSDAKELKRLADFDGPGIAALLGEGCARFVHDPSAGATLAERLVVTHLPAPPQRAIGRVSLFKQLEELRQLECLAAVAKKEGQAMEVGVAMEVAEAGAARTSAGASGAALTPADRLAALLLRQADLGNVA